jgi:hypothetical protein
MPDREKVDDILVKLWMYSNLFQGPDNTTVEFKYYIIELYEELFGKGERPRWMMKGE